MTRPVTRYGRADTSFSFETKREGTPTDLARGTRRARAAALLAMALPGSLYVYQGEELGLPEVEDIPVRAPPGPDVAAAPAASTPAATAAGFRCPGAATGLRTASAPTAPSRPWLDQPADWAQLTVAAQSAESTSMLALYREGLRLRRSAPWGATRACAGFRRADSVLAFERGERLRLPRQLRPGAGPTAGRRRRPDRQRRARRRCAPAGHHGLAPARSRPSTAPR